MDDIQFTCPNCESVVSVERQYIGFSVPCPKCHDDITVPPVGIITGMQIGDFVVERRLGAGGMGEVWLASQQAMQRQIALKILAPQLVANKEFVERFLQEAKMAGKLIHQNIVTAHHAGEDNNIYYLAISYVDGITLEDRLEIEGNLSEQEALEIVCQMAEALKYAWNNFKILHRDVKPANIMIKLDGTAMLMDMGVSKSLMEETSLTMTGAVMGTPMYISPEQAKAEGNIDFRSDMYSLGATLFHMLTGQIPYDATSAMGIISKHITEPLPDCRSINPDISSGCKALIEKMMKKSPGERYTSWEELLIDLNAVKQGVLKSSRESILSPKLLIGGAVAAGLVIAGVSFAVLSNKPDSPDVIDKKKPHVAAGSAKEKQELQAIQAFQQKFPDRYDELIIKYEALQKAFPNTPVEIAAVAQIKTLKAKRAEAIKALEETIHTRVRALLQEQKYDEALTLVQMPTEQYATETKAFREKMENRIHRHMKETQQTQAETVETVKTTKEPTQPDAANIAKAKKTLVKRSAELIANGKYKTAWKEFTDNEARSTLPELETALEQLADLSNRFQDSIKKSVGQSFMFEENGKLVNGTIKGIKNGRIICSVAKGPVVSQRSIPIRKLPVSVKRNYMAQAVDSYALCLYEIRSCIRSKQFSEAMKKAANASELEQALKQEITRLEKEYVEKKAEDDFEAILNIIGIKNISLGNDKLYSIIENKKISRKASRSVKGALYNFKRKYRKVDLFQKYKPLLEMIAGKVGAEQKTLKGGADRNEIADLKRLLKERFHISDEKWNEFFPHLKRFHEKLNKLSKQSSRSGTQRQYRILGRNTMGQAEDIFGRGPHIRDIGEYVRRKVEEKCGDLMDRRPDDRRRDDRRHERERQPDHRFRKGPAHLKNTF